MRPQGHPLLDPLEPRTLLAAGNFYLTSWNSDPELREYNQAGALVRRIPLPKGVADGDPRDVILDGQGRTHVFHGTFDPVLTTKAGGAFSHHTAAEWSTANVLDYGGIAAHKQFVFVTDQNTANDEAEGLIRFDTANNYAVTRFADGTQPCDVTMGLDGLLYAIENSGPPLVRVYNPDTLALVRTVTLPWQDLRCAAADAQGNIYAGEWGKRLHKIAPDGTVLKTITQPHSTVDLDFATDGTLMIRIHGEVKFYDTNLNLLNAVAIPNQYGNFVAWATPQAAPEAPRPASVSGTVFADLNANATRNPTDVPLANWRVFVDANQNGKYDQGELFDQTDDAGAYTIPNVPPGTHRLKVELKPGYRLTNPGKRSFLPISVASRPLAGRNFLATDRSRVSGTVFLDTDRDAKRDAGEAGRANVQVFLDKNNDGDRDRGEPWTLTDNKGNYVFTDVAPGTYTLRTLRPKGLTSTAPKGAAYALTFSTARILTNQNFGYRKRT